MPGRKVAVIGLDCAEPSLAFDAFADDMPNLRALMRAGSWGKLESTMPPITVPAWTSMVSGYDPGELGIYGFRNRRRGSYELDFATSQTVKVPRLWDLVGRHGKRSIVFAVPQSYPPPERMNGMLVGCFLTPDAGSRYTCPDGLRGRLHERFGPYIVDVEGFRTPDKRGLLSRIYEMTEQHYRMAEWLVAEHEWDFFMMVEMGIDRFHHGFFKYIDPRHPLYEKGNEFEDEGRRFYRFNDEWIGRLVERLPRETAVLVVSDHGAKRMKGGVCINELLLREGYLALAGEAPRAVTPIKKVAIDWSRTKAWGEGGYYARVFFNVKGREPQGIVGSGAAYDALRGEVEALLAGLKDAEGNPLGSRVLRAEDIYRKVEGFPPDLICLFGDLDYRSVGSLGGGGIITMENDTGPDDANHDFHGMLVMSGDGVPARGEIEGAAIYDVAPTVCRLLGVPYDEPTRARSLV